MRYPVIKYHISSYSFVGNYSFLNFEIQRSQYIRPKVRVHKCAETIRGNTVIIIGLKRHELCFGEFLNSELFLTISMIIRQIDYNHKSINKIISNLTWTQRPRVDGSRRVIKLSHFLGQLFNLFFRLFRHCSIKQMAMSNNRNSNITIYIRTVRPLAIFYK